MSYSRLPTESASAEDFSSKDSDALLPGQPESPATFSVAKARTRSDRWMVYTSIISIVIAAINAIWLSVDLYKLRSPSSLPTHRPSTYLGFENVVRNSSSPNWPLRRFDFPEYYGILDSAEANVKSSNSRRILLDDKRTVIMLFTVHDYGLENCAIASLFPIQSRQAPHRSYTGEGHIESIEVWLLEEPEKPWFPLEPPTTYSWNTKPSRQRSLGTLNATAVRDYTPSFHCKSQSTFLIELACANPDCKLDFIQDRAAPRFGYWLLQSEEERR